MNITITQYKWAGSWGPFSIKIPCGECSLTEGTIRDVVEKEFPTVTIDFKVLPWLDNWLKVLLQGGYHAPVVFVGKKLVGQGRLIDRGLIAAAIRSEIAKNSKLPTNKNIFFGKEGCSICKTAKEFFKKKGIEYEYKDVITDPLASTLLIAFVKPNIPANKPLTVPQIFLKGEYIGGYDDLMKHFSVKANKPLTCPAN